MAKRQKNQRLGWLRAAVLLCWELPPGDNGINKEFPGRVPHGNAALQTVSADLFGVRVCLADDLAGLRDKGPFSVF